MPYLQITFISPMPYLQITFMSPMPFFQVYLQITFLSPMPFLRIYLLKITLTPSKPFLQICFYIPRALFCKFAFTSPGPCFTLTPMLYDHFATDLSGGSESANLGSGDDCLEKKLENFGTLCPYMKSGEFHCLKPFLLF